MQVWTQNLGKRPATVAADDRLLSACLYELDEMVGCGPSDRQWVTDTDPRWSDGFALTGMTVGAGGCAHLSLSLSLSLMLLHACMHAIAQSIHLFVSGKEGSL